VTVKSVEAPKVAEIDDEFAKKYGFDSLDALKTAMRGNLEADFEKASRDKFKRALLDALDARYKFDLPASLVENEFAGIWRDYEAERKRAGQGEPEADKNEDETRAEYRAIAERRVRLGLVLAEIGQKAGVTVEEKDLTDAVVERARSSPARRRKSGTSTARTRTRSPRSARRSTRSGWSPPRRNRHGLRQDRDPRELFAEDEEKPSAAA